MSGNDILIVDLKALLKEAEEFQFDDFKNTKYAAPKMTLYLKLIRLSQNVKEGKYD